MRHFSRYIEARLLAKAMDPSKLRIGGFFWIGKFIINLPILYSQLFEALQQGFEFSTDDQSKIDTLVNCNHNEDDKI